MEIQFDRIPVDKESCSCVVQIHTRTFQIILGVNIMCDGVREKTKQEMIAEINRLIEENAVLKVKLEAVYESAEIKKVENEEKYRIEELERICKDLQDQHQQDCIRYNDMRTAFLKTVDELAMLRKQFGVGQ